MRLQITNANNFLVNNGIKMETYYWEKITVLSAYFVRVLCDLSDESLFCK